MTLYWPDHGPSDGHGDGTVLPSSVLWYVVPLLIMVIAQSPRYVIRFSNCRRLVSFANRPNTTPATGTYPPGTVEFKAQWRYWVVRLSAQETGELSVPVHHWAHLLALVVEREGRFCDRSCLEAYFAIALLAGLVLGRQHAAATYSVPLVE